MSHGDKIVKQPKGFIPIAHTNNSPVAAMADKSRKFYALQFHPEVAHTENGTKILKNFVFNVCKCKPKWTMQSFIDTTTREIKERVGKDKVVCAISGGVDSAVTAVLINRAIGKQLTCIFVDNGVLREGEALKVENMLKKHFRMNMICVDAAQEIFKEDSKGSPILKRKERSSEMNLYIYFRKRQKRSRALSILRRAHYIPMS